MADLPALPDGYSLDAASPPLPPGYAIDQPPPPQEPSGVANAITGLQSGVGNLIGMPNSFARLAQGLKPHLGIAAEGLLGLDVAGRVERNTPSPEDINSGLYAASGKANEAVGLPAPQPYQPQTAEGRMTQDVLGNAVPALVGGGGLPAATARFLSGAGGTTAADLYGQAHPDSYWGRLAAALTGTLAGGGAASGANRIGGAVASRLNPRGAANPIVAGQLSDAAGMPGGDLAATIDQNLPNWTTATPGARPTLGNVTESPGIRSLEATDQGAALSEGDLVYQTNRAATNAAQRAAITGATPDTSTTLAGLIADRDAAVNAIPPGISAQDAGQQFRQQLQSVYDQRTATRAAGGTAFDALATSPARVNMQPVVDYATGQAAQNAGEVGQAYAKAVAQFRSPTGLTLDTAPFANSVLSGLGDLASGYPRGSASARAVLDVKGRLEEALGPQVPEIAAARAQWAANSRPLDVFETRPFAQVIATDRFGRSYAMPNDAVAAAFLRGNGSADALDQLHQVFGDPQASTRALQDYIAGQVQRNAVRADGSIDAAAMQRTVAPYQRALIRFRQLSGQFRTAEGAQAALDQQLAAQQIHQIFRDGLGTVQTDAAGNPMYSPAQFDRAVQQYRPLLAQAYGQDGANTILRVNDQLSSIAQGGVAAGGQAAGAAGRSGRLGALAGSVMGAALEQMLGSHLGGFAGAYIGSKVGEAAQGMLGTNQRLLAAVDSLRRQALTDPAFAANLLKTYSPRLPTSAMRSALQYVIERAPGLATPLNTLSQPPQGPAMLLPSTP